MKHITTFFFALICLCAKAQYVSVSTPGMATIQYDDAQGIATFFFPMEEYPIEWPARVVQCVQAPDYTEQVCIISEKFVDGLPIFWVYAVGGDKVAEIHIPSLGAVYTTGDKTELLRAPKPPCYFHLIDAKY
ncbi:MAG: hypothetical protein ACR2K1_14170 [Saprospiraceae bacterium]